jgi:hypothetical protein
MKTSVIFCTVLVTITAGIFSCTKAPVPSPGSSCNELTLASSPVSDSQVVGINCALVTIDYAISGGQSATASGLPAGITGIISGGSMMNIVGSPTVTGTFGYTVTTTDGCSKTGTIIVVPPTVTTITAGVATTTSVSFNWTAVAGSTGYNVTYTVNGGAIQTGGVITGTTFTISSLNSGDVVIITVTPIGAGLYGPAPASATNTAQ